MASIFSKLGRFAQSPQGRRFAEKAKGMASDPQNRQKIDDLRRRVARKKAA